MPSDTTSGEQGRAQRHLRVPALLTLGLLLAALSIALLSIRPGPASAPTPEVSPTATASATPPSKPTATAPPLPSRTPTTTHTATAAAPSGPQVIITARDPIAEYVEIQNRGEAVIALDGWRLVSERGNQVCWLSGPLYPGERLRIWADGGYEVGLHCRFRRNIWSNTEPDAAVLYDAQGEVVSRLE